MVKDTLLKSYVSVGSPRSILVGLSGGADSVALLVCLCGLRHEIGFGLSAVHVNHGLRENARGDEAYCRALCARLDVPLICSSVEIKAKCNIESEARTARYAAFNEAMVRTGAEMLALAHHADDQAETVIMHLLYGTGAAGLGGMHEHRNGLWRPFLRLRRDDLQNYLRAQEISWREDESNADIDFTRNRIRAQIMPCLESCAPEVVCTIGRTAEIMRSEDECLNAFADDWLEKHASDSSFPFILADELKTQHTALLRRIIRRYAARCGIELDFEQTERVRKLLDCPAGSVENMPQGWQALKTKARLHFVKNTTNEVSGRLFIDNADDALPHVLVQALPENQTEGLVLRGRQTGDYIQPFGMKGSKSLKEYMIDHGVDRPFRDAWPLVCRGKEVLWVVGIGASEKLRVEEKENSEHRLIFSGELPDHV